MIKLFDSSLHRKCPMTFHRTTSPRWLRSTISRSLRLAFTIGLLGLVVAIMAGKNPLLARDLHVDPQAGDDLYDGVTQPVRTIARSIRLAQPGDTIHLQPVVYQDWAAFYDKTGEPDRPITLDGHGATLDGCDPLDPATWQEESPGLFRHDDLLPLTDAIVDRWFFLWDGKLNRMSRCSKGPSEPLKLPNDLKPGEWTFVKDVERTKADRPGYIHGSFFLRLPPRQTLAEAQIQAPLRPAGVLMHGQCRHLVVRHLTSTHPYNDGFNLSDARDILFENIRAIDCGDDGISAHGDCRYRVEGLTSIGNATGICDTGNSETAYRHVFIRDCVGFDLFFLDTGRYSLSDSVVLSSAARSLYLQGRNKPSPPCCVTLDNVLLRRERGENDVRVSTNCRLTARRVTFQNLDIQATGGDFDLQQSFFGGTVPASTPRKPTLFLWRDATWHGVGNRYDIGSLRVDQTIFTAETFAKFQELVFAERDSHWQAVSETDPLEKGIGVDELRLLPSFERDLKK